MDEQLTFENKCRQATAVLESSWKRARQKSATDNQLVIKQARESTNNMTLSGFIKLHGQGGISQLAVNTMLSAKRQADRHWKESQRACRTVYGNEATNEALATLRSKYRFM